ncbi:site-specific integrase [Terribacillus saccharophilus]|uniref:site-specific integrase n=1 Tax=Terribacillus saccharophilus TaxID=361277 RepID=UPI0039819F08
MNEKNVQPLRTQAEIEEMKWALRRFGTERDRFLFVFGINTGLRVSDIVPLKVGDVRDKQHVIQREKKTGKPRRFFMNAKLREEIAEYTAGMGEEEYLFPSRKGTAPISTTQAYRVLTKAAAMLERDDIGTHTMRKTFGYHYYKRTKDVASLQTLFNHSAPSITLKYIGITDEEIEASLVDFSL